MRHKLRDMKLKSLLMCRNPHTVRLFATMLEKFGIGQECCSSAQEAIELITRGNYSALAVDFDLPGAAHAAKFSRTAPPQRRPVVFGIIGACTEIEAALHAGVNFPVYKPLEPEQVAHSIRAAYGFIREDRRSAPRYPVETVVYLMFGKKQAVPALMLNLSETGFCVQAAERLPSFERVDVHFLLPGTRRAIEGTAELVWTDDSGKAGMFFSEITVSAQRFLRNWLATHASKNEPARGSSAPRVRPQKPAAVLV